MSNIEEQLRSALTTIHDNLHQGRIKEAESACHDALKGAIVMPVNITLSDAAKLDAFMRAFNELADRYKLVTCAVTFVPSKIDAGKTSIQLGGHQGACQMVSNVMKLAQANSGLTAEK